VLSHSVVADIFNQINKIKFARKGENLRYYISLFRFRYLEGLPLSQQREVNLESAISPLWKISALDIGLFQHLSKFLFFRISKCIEQQ